MVVKVWTSLLKRLFFISERNTANTIGTQLVAIPRPLIARVFLRTFTISFLVALFWKSEVNHLKPTNLSMVRSSPAL